MTSCFQAGSSTCSAIEARSCATERASFVFQSTIRACQAGLVKHCRIELRSSKGTALTSKSQSYTRLKARMSVRALYTAAG
ncbi:hypothetical protein SAMN05421835_106285 [Amycolatopsis sacchari]|uniref:Uncharacterized protein n=1 Tax=Amycolatopsis sacchari TaxID=115433 RepID=A0A1I3SDY1_9PSEU|nr:hypothetical protein SAMN05421835_106285 [Amycolatopsis sacchari]